MKFDFKSENVDYLFKAILTLGSVDECYEFFGDLCTKLEIEEMSRRFSAARMLSDNIVFSEISSRTGLSTATISRVNRALNFGTGGYSKAIDAVKLREKYRR